MSEPFVYDSRCELCKTPFGAAACLTEITLHLRPLAKEGFSHCALVLFYESAGFRTERELSCDGPEAERVRFSLTFSAPSQPDLLWYHFRFWREDGSGCFLDRFGYRSEGAPADWQITVYDGASSTPDWFGEGVTYQIFPDRFSRLSVPDANGLVGSRTVHQDWEELPDWKPNEKGEILNRDFFGGSLAGITSRLDELAALSITTLYLCPIFESASNHRYNTADYRKIDPLLGTEEDFRTLCTEAAQRGIHVILDGVFNHTGSNSVYFNADGFYPESGAAQSKDSPWFGWYHFTDWPEKYDAWWGIRTLPAVREDDPGYGSFIIDGEDSVIRHWLRAGADGWRLDVADELPDEFIARIRRAIDETKPGSFLLGEVWEDGSNKIAYSKRRRYLLGHEVHGLMNYPFRTAALAYLKGGDASDFRETMESLRENYPPASYFSAMNFLGTHDTPRILTALGAETVPSTKDARAAYRLSPEEYDRGRRLLALAALLLFAFPGSPTVFYGDETGMQGFEDPFNRGTYPWGREDQEILDRYRLLGRLRRERVSLRRGNISYLYALGPGLAFSREAEGERTLAVFNAGEEPLMLSLPWAEPAARDVLSGGSFSAVEGSLSLSLPPCSGLLLV